MQNETKLTKFLYQLLEWIMNLSVINILWLIFNIPIIILTIYMLINKNNHMIFMFVIAICFILLFYPATTAMYASVRGCILHTDHRASFKKYWAFYKGNYVRSTQIGLLMVPLWIIWYINTFLLIIHINTIIFMCFLLIGLIYFVYNVNVFSINVHYHYRLNALLMNTVFITFGSARFFLSLLIGFIFVISVSLLMMRTIFTLFIVFFTGSLFSLVSFAVFYQYYLKALPKEK